MQRLKKWYTLPFFGVLTVLTAVAFVIPLRPEVSYSEKRELAQFPEFSVDTFLNGEYFSGISTWFSDTFPGREDWLTLSQDISSLHGYGFFYVQGPRPQMAAAQTEQETPRQTADTADTEPTVVFLRDIRWDETPLTAQLLSASESSDLQSAAADGNQLDFNISDAAVIQMGDMAFFPVGASEASSNRYIRALNALAQKTGKRVVNAVSPTAVGVVVPEQYLPSLNSASQKELLDYIGDGLDSGIIHVDTVSALKAHTDEYLYFRTDHHWTADGAYYSYEAICNALGMTPASRSDFQALDQGRFLGSLYGKAANQRKLKEDSVMSYVPQGNITMEVLDNDFPDPREIVRDLSGEDENTKYLAFLFGDCKIVHIVNEDIPDGGTCLIVKDSFGNCLVPYFTMNYHEIYAIDYRKFDWHLAYASEFYQVDDIIFVPNMMAVESTDGTDRIALLCE